MKSMLYISLAVLLFMANNLVAQVATNFNNENIISSKGQFEKNYNSTIDVIIPAKNIDSLLFKEKLEGAQSNELKPFKLAAPSKINLDIAKLVNWAYDKEFAYGKFTLKLSGALSASISFDKFYLPKNTELFVYNENGKMITGPVTEKENNKTGIWGSWVYQGELLTIEIKTPIASLKELILHSDNVAYGYKEIYKSIKVGGFGQSGSCNINVICPLGNGWEGERNSVSTILSADGGEFCTGSLIMNTCGRNTPYYLTANHCFEQGNSNVPGWRFAFQAWSTTCPNPGVNTNGVMYNGATLRARNAPSDFCLVELNQTPPANSGLHYAGWNRSANPAQNATGIHHPSGDLMKISRANNAVTVGSFNGTTNQHWRANWSPQDNGAGQTVTPITEGGSSGSPLFDQNHRIIGQLHGGPSFCGSSQPWDFYGRFDLSWAGGGTNATRLSNWLDPAGSNAMTTNTTNVANLQPSGLNLSISGDNNFCNSGSYILNGSPAGSNIIWTISPAYAATLTPIGNQVTVNPNTNAENSILTATVSNICGVGTSQVQKQIAIGVPNHVIDVLDGTMPLAEVDIHMNTSYSLGVTEIDGPYLNAATASYIWQVNFIDPYGGQAGYYLGTYGYGYTPPFIFDQYGQYQIILDIVNNSCAYHSRYFTRQITFQNPYGRFSISPNPSTDNIRISPNNNIALKTNAKPLKVVAIEIINKMGVLKHQQTFSKGLTTVNISVSQLPNDVYTLRIFDGQKWHSNKIIVQH